MDFLSAPPYLRSDTATLFWNPPGTPFFLRKAVPAQEEFGVPEKTAAEWRAKQEAFLRWAKDAQMFCEAEVKKSYFLYNRFFEARGPLRGRVLDVGGGWGLFREWWRADPQACFTVHDPGAERFMSEPPESIRRYFRDGLSRAAWFVEGYGENLPYEDQSYDIALIAAALDHCADPPRVLAECHRVLKPGGALLVLQHVEPEARDTAGRIRRHVRRVISVLADMQRLRRAMRRLFVHPGDPHLHHFSAATLKQLVEAARFEACAIEALSAELGIVAVQARKGA